MASNGRQLLPKYLPAQKIARIKPNTNRFHLIFDGSRECCTFTSIKLIMYFVEVPTGCCSFCLLKHFNRIN